MNEESLKEIEYLNGILKNIDYSKDLFNLFVDDETQIVGVIGGNNNSLTKYMSFKTLYNTILDLDKKIKKSFREAISIAYSEEFVFDPYCVELSEVEELVYYYIENALFRIEISWDILAQLYVLYYDIDVPVDKIYYKRVFNPGSNRYCADFMEKASELNAYFSEDDSTETDGAWKGNHKYMVDYRNKMTHRNSPNIPSWSNYDFSFKDHPAYIIKRLEEDYSMAYKHTIEFLCNYIGTVDEGKILDDLI